MIPTACLRDSAVITSFQGESAYGRVDAGTVTVPCRAHPVQRLVTHADGSVQECVAIMEVRPDVQVAPQDLVTIGATSYRVLSVAEHSELSRTHSLVVSLGRSET